MWRFVLQENIRRYRDLLAKAESETDTDRLRQLLQATELELSEINEASTPDVARRDGALRMLAEHAVEGALKRHNAQFSSLQIHDPRREFLIILAQKNFRAPFLHHLALMKPGDGSACGRCLEEDAPAAIHDVHRDPAFEPHREAAREAGFRAVQASPVRNGSGETIAIISTYFSAPQDFSEKQLNRLVDYAGSIGAGLQRCLGA